MSYYFRKKNGDDKKEDERYKNLTSVKIYTSKATLQKLKDLAKKTKSNISRMCAIAIDNEFDTEEPFNYPCEISTEPYTEYEYASEAQKLYDFFLSFDHRGVHIIIPMLSRRDLGIESRETLMGALRELLEKSMVEKFNYDGRFLKEERYRIKKL